jgi:hypothetical protein
MVLRYSIGLGPIEFFPSQVVLFQLTSSLSQTLHYSITKASQSQRFSQLDNQCVIHVREIPKRQIQTCVLNYLLER